MQSISRVLAHNLTRALKEGRLDEAAGLLDRLKVEAPLDIKTRGLEFEYLIERRRFTEADELGKQLLHLFPESSRILFLAGRLAYRKKDYRGAVNHFRESNRLHPHWRSTWWLGKALTQANQLDEAQALLESVRDRNMFVIQDLGWLFERKKELERALECYESIVDKIEDPSFLRNNIDRVRAQLIDPDEMVEEFEQLAEFGEAIPDHLLADYVRNLFAAGRTEEAREAVRSRMDDVDAKTAVSVAWACHHFKACDLAFVLFIRHLEKNMYGDRFLSALEYDARMCHRIPELINAYKPLADRHKGFYGRIKKLARHLNS